MESDNLIERYEYKYHVPLHLVGNVRETAQMMCSPDKHAGPDGSYTIRSLYFDTDRYQLYWANMREQADRFKLRARGYPGKKAPVFLEVKRRVYDVIMKSRGAVPEAKWKDILLGKASPGEAYGGKTGRRATEHFIQRMYMHNIRPKILVEYDREAYESKYDKYARLTFDRAVRCQRMEELSFEADPKQWRHVDHEVRTQSIGPICLLELKFENTPPRWMINLIKRLELVRYSFSKYCYSVDSQLLLPESRSVNPRWELPQ